VRHWKIGQLSVCDFFGFKMIGCSEDACFVIIDLANLANKMRSSRLS
jgi:hypothetical protein